MRLRPAVRVGRPGVHLRRGNTPTTLFAEDFEDGLAGWDPGLPTVPAGGDTASRGRRLPTLPGDHTGTVAWGPDPDVHCATRTRSSADFLASRQHRGPGDVASPRLSFDHYVATEVDFDGGNVQLSVNGGPFTADPGGGLHLQRAEPAARDRDGNDNPLAGQPAFSGADGGTVRGTWVASQVSLTAAGRCSG